MRSHRLNLLFATAATAGLVACGGGSDSDSATPAPAPAPTAAATCSALVSGTYRGIEPAPAGQATLTETVVISMDSSGTPQIASAGSAAATLTPGPAPCSFTAPDQSSVVVSPSGVVVMAAVEGSSRYPAILFPEQSAAVGDLAGTWNRLTWARAGSGGLTQPYELQYGSLTLQAGVVTGGKECSVAADLAGGCNDFEAPAGLTFTPDAAGGFSSPDGARAFAYRKGSDIMVVIVDGDGTTTFLTPQSAQTLPTVGTTSTSWGLRANTAGALAVSAGGTMPGISPSTNTITEVDAANKIVTRDNSDEGAAAVSQTLRYDTPLPGFRKRDGSATTSSAITLSLRGMGLAVTSRLGATAATTPGTGNGFLAISVSGP